MADHVTRDVLLTTPAPEADVAVTAGTVRVRALTEVEVEDLKTLSLKVVEREAVIVHLCMVAPTLDLTEAAAWLAVATPADIDRVTGVVLTLSGIGTEPWRSR